MWQLERHSFAIEQDGLEQVMSETAVHVSVGCEPSQFQGKCRQLEAHCSLVRLQEQPVRAV